MRKILPGAYVKQTTQAEFPLANCNMTSLYMAMDASGKHESDIIGLANDVAGAPKLTPVDFLTRLGDSKAAVDAMHEICPWFFKNGQAFVRPPEAPLMLDWIASQTYGGNPVKYTEGLTLSLLVEKIDAGRATILRTLFTKAGHIVAAVGYETDDAGKLSGVILRDPYGNPVNGYSNPAESGNEVTITTDMFFGWVREPGVALKAAHVLVF